MNTVREPGYRPYTPEQLVARFGRAELGTDGDAAFALLGPNLQDGEAEFVTIPDEWDDRLSVELRACKLALEKLRARLAPVRFSYFLGSSHPYNKSDWARPSKPVAAAAPHKCGRCGEANPDNLDLASGCRDPECPERG